MGIDALLTNVFLEMGNQKCKSK